MTSQWNTGAWDSSTPPYPEQQHWGTNRKNSAFYFTGKDITNERLTFIGKKKDSQDYHKNYVKRSQWVQHLNAHKITDTLTPSRKQETIEWFQNTVYTRHDIDNLILSRHV